MSNMTKEEIMDLVLDEDVEFIRLQFTDAFGELKNLAVTSRQLDKVFEGRYAFDGSSLYGRYKLDEQDMYLIPDLDSFVILPWRPQQGKVARMLCDVKKADGSMLDVSPREVLRRSLKKAKDLGYTIYVNPQCEFFLFHTDDNGMPTTITHEHAGFLDVSPMDLGENARRGIVEDLESMGFEVEASYHEKAPAQHEIEFASGEASDTADAIVTFKNAVRSIAKRFGLHATFMPKPVSGNPGSGLHLSFSVYKDDRNIFNAKDGQVNDEAKYFMGGILKYAKEMTPFTNPLVNSYKRLNGGFDAPNKINWTTTNADALIKVGQRLGDDAKVEVRFPDPAANPYITIALMIEAGLRGLEEQIDPGLECASECEHMPETLKEAIESMRDSDFVKSVVGEEYFTLYLAEKIKEWNDYMSQVSEWEISQYFSRT